LGGSRWSRAKIASILLLGLVAWVLYEFSSSYAFFVYEATIGGNHLLPAETIYAASGVHEQSIFWLSPKEIAARIEAQPYVKRAVVHCQLPNRVIIEVTERSPKVVWRTGQGEFWVDEEGVALTPLEGQPPPLLLIDDEGRAAAKGEEKRVKAGIVEGILLVSERMPEVKWFRYDRKWGVLFQSPHGWQVALGYGERMRYKVNVLIALQERLLAEGKHPRVIDMRFPEAIHYY